MRMIHEDSLNRLLRKEQLEELQPYRDVLLDLSIIASESRKYLNIRQALEKRLDEIIAGEHEFLENVRQIRSKYIRKAILK